jgi:hypothetical protein
MDLADQLEARAHALVERALITMYVNPFWLERFGERGREFARADNHHHLSYLVTALRTGSPESLIHYARWVQQVLTTRGMCTRHLTQNFASLAEAIESEGLRSAHAADAYLKAAQDALLYPDDPAHAVQAVATEVVRRAVDIIVADRAERFERADDSGRSVWVDDLTYQVSYLADALALERTDVFAEYVVWSAATFKRRAIPAKQLVEELAAIDAALGRMPIRVQVRDAARGALETVGAGLGELLSTA